jgi:serine/threonine protein kinase
MFYEDNYRKGNYKPFEKLLTGFYDEDFTQKQHIENMVEDERKYSLFLHNFIKKFGYDLDLNSPYFVGFGSTAIVYNVSKNGQNYIMKFIWGNAPFEKYVTSLEGQMLVESAGLVSYVPKLYFSVFEHEPQIFDYLTISNEKDSTSISYGIIIQEYAGVSLKTLKSHLSPSNIKDVCQQLRTLKQLFLLKGIVHDDLHDENITINKEGKVQVIDLEEVKLLQPVKTRAGFGHLDDVIAELCN